MIQLNHIEKQAMVKVNRRQVLILSFNTNTGRFANESVRQRSVHQRMKSICQRRMSVRQHSYPSHFGTQCPKYFFRLARQWMKERGISCMARG